MLAGRHFTRSGRRLCAFCPGWSTKAEGRAPASPFPATPSHSNSFIFCWQFHCHRASLPAFRAFRSPDTFLRRLRGSKGGLGYAGWSRGCCPSLKGGRFLPCSQLRALRGGWGGAVCEQTRCHRHNLDAPWAQVCGDWTNSCPEVRLRYLRAGSSPVCSPCKVLGGSRRLRRCMALPACLGCRHRYPKLSPRWCWGSISTSLLGCAWLGPLLLLNAGKGQQEAEGRPAPGCSLPPLGWGFFSFLLSRHATQGALPWAGKRGAPLPVMRWRHYPLPLPTPVPAPGPCPFPFPLPARGSRRSSALCSTARPRRTGHPGRGSRRFSGTFRVSAPAAAGGGVGVPAAPLPPGRPPERVALHAVKTPCALRCSAGEEQRIYVRSECPVPQRWWCFSISCAAWEPQW